MTSTFKASASNLVPRYGHATFDCSGAQIRALSRHLATVVTLQGQINTANLDRVGECIRRFLLTKDRLVLDLSDVKSFAQEGVSLLLSLAEECRAAGVECRLVVSRAVAEVLPDNAEDAVLPTEGSVHDALRHFGDVIAMRRELLLPLIRKTA